MELRRVHVSTQLATHGLQPDALWDLLQRVTVSPEDRITASLPPYFLDTEESGAAPGAGRSGTRRDVEQTTTSVRVTLTRWVECPSSQVTAYEQRFDDELASTLKELRVAVGRARLAPVGRRV